MSKAKDCLRNNAAMTLVEILVSLVLLGLVLIAIFPLLTQSLQVTNLANRITAQLFADQEDIEIVAATNGGVLFADGTFLPNKEFKVVFGDIEPVIGLTVKKGKLIRYIASIAHIKAAYVYEGYNTAAEAKIPITGIKTNFINTTLTKLTVTDRLGNDVTNQCSNYAITSKTEAEFTLPTGSNRFTNELSPYTITMTTGNERASTLLPVHLPRGIAIESNHNLIISSNGTNWISKSTSSIINKDINKIVFMSTSGENDARYIAVGRGGGIYLWLNQRPWEKMNSPTNEDLNNIIYCSGNKNLLLACGDGGVILTSADGIHWTRQNSKTDEDLRAISYLADSDRFVCVGAQGGILISDNGINWTRQNIYPRLAEINGNKAVEFSGAGDYLITEKAPVTGNNKRTVIMVAYPQNPTANLLAWGSPLDKITGSLTGGRFSFGIDNNGKLNVEQHSMEASFSAQLSPYLANPPVPSIFICRSSSGYFEDYELFLNGESGESQQSSDQTPINTQNHFPAQLGSDPLTRYDGPHNFKGLIAEVLVFDDAVSDNRDLLDPPDPSNPDNRKASQLDLLRAYLSKKYDLNLDNLAGTQISNLFLPDGVTSLQAATIDQCHSAVSYDHLVLWLDASDDRSLDSQKIKSEDQVLQWNDLSGYINIYFLGRFNNAAGASLNAVACSSNKVVTGGYHRNLLHSINASSWSQTHQLKDKRITEYELSDMAFCNDQFVALVNDGLSPGNPNNRDNGLVAYSEDGKNWAFASGIASGIGQNYILNDMYYGMSAGTILVVGNSGRMFTSSDNGKNWETVTSGTSNNLLAGCIR